MPPRLVATWARRASTSASATETPRRAASAPQQVGADGGFERLAVGERLRRQAREAQRRSTSALVTTSPFTRAATTAASGFEASGLGLAEATAWFVAPPQPPASSTATRAGRTSSADVARRRRRGHAAHAAACVRPGRIAGRGCHGWCESWRRVRASGARRRWRRRRRTASGNSRRPSGPSPAVPTTSSGGIVMVHGSGCMRGQRGWNTQPEGGLAGLGTSPSRMRRRRCALGARVGDRHRREQRLGVGVLRLVVELLAVGDLDDLAEVHHGDAVGDVLHDRRGRGR